MNVKQQGACMVHWIDTFDA